MTTPQSGREAFEEAASRVYGLASRKAREVMFMRMPVAEGEQYCNQPMEWAHQIWQAALAQQGREVGELVDGVVAINGRPHLVSDPEHFVRTKKAQRLYTAATPETGNWICADDVNRLVRELDVALNGEDGAAEQASLCDLVAQVQSTARANGAPLLAAPKQEGRGVGEVTEWQVRFVIPGSKEWSTWERRPSRDEAEIAISEWEQEGIAAELRPLYTATPKQQGVTDEDVRWCCDIAGALREAGGPTNAMRLVALERLIRAALLAALPGKTEVE